MYDRESEEMYLETILRVRREKGEVRAVDVAEELGYARSSTSRAMGLLKSRGFISIAQSGAITLTESGEKRASSVYDRHRIITKVLIGLGVGEDSAEENACRIEHVISDDVYEALKAQAEKVDHS